MNFRANDLTALRSPTERNFSGETANPENSRALRAERKLSFEREEEQSSSRHFRITVSDLETGLGEWVFECEYERQSKATVRGKREVVEKLIWWLKREKLSLCRAIDIKRFLHYVGTAHGSPHGRWDEALQCIYRDRHGRLCAEVQNAARQPDARAFAEISDRSLQLYHVYLHGFFEFLASPQMGMVTASPMPSIKKAKPKKPRVLPFSVEEVRLLLLAAGRGPCPKRDTALVYFLLDTGVRAAELCGLKLSDVKLSRGVATVMGKGRKERDVCFDVDTRRVLVAYLKSSPCEEEEFVFRSQGGNLQGQGMTPSGITQIIQRLGKAAGIADKRCSAHTFRHTFATEFIKNGGSAKALQMLLGHEDLQMTMRYVTLAQSDVESQHRHYSPARMLRR